jgi:hypothetical protein
MFQLHNLFVEASCSFYVPVTTRVATSKDILNSKNRAGTTYLVVPRQEKFVTSRSQYLNYYGGSHVYLWYK